MHAPGACGPLRLTLWTDDPDLALRAQAAGVDRVGPDLERLGKVRRQHGLGTWISGHDERALPALAAVLGATPLFVRCDPPHPGTAAQVDRLVAAGARVLMLPMYRDDADVRRFVEAVAGRAQVVLLLETREAAARVRSTAAIPGVEEIHVGLNDLALDLGLPSRFAVLGSAVLDEIADAVHAAGVDLGVGGVARVGDTALPVPPDLVYARLAALGATGAIIARSFLHPGSDLTADVAAARERYASWCQKGADDLTTALRALRRAAANLREWS